MIIKLGHMQLIESMNSSVKLDVLSNYAMSRSSPIRWKSAVKFTSDEFGEVSLQFRDQRFILVRYQGQVVTLNLIHSPVLSVHIDNNENWRGREPVTIIFVGVCNLKGRQS